MARKDTILHLRSVLIRRRDALRRALKGDLTLLKELHAESPGDVLDAAMDTASGEINSQLVEVESRELEQIEEAIARIKEGTYGTCEVCEKQIPLKRLQALPYATECIDCKRQLEAGPGANVAPTWEQGFSLRMNAASEADIW